MLDLLIVTYLRKDEALTTEILEIGNRLHDCYPKTTMEVIVDTDSAVVPEKTVCPIKFALLQGTKFSKLTEVLQRTRSRYILSLDNDIAADLSNLVSLVTQTVDGDYDLSWARIHTRHVSTIISRLVEVDKLVSHTLLRPLLWKHHLGVTIPGQCFLLKTVCFRGQLPKTDTFLDDLSIGLYAAKHRLKYLYVDDVVAYELPAYSFVDLWKQRLRWATGFRQSMSCTTLTMRDKRLLYFHAFCYHFVPVLHQVSLAFLFPWYPLPCSIWLAALALLISRTQLWAFWAAVVYILIFPIFHLGWWWHLLRSIVRDSWQRARN
jgi:cellulose synthase/poly-beta-1,6-N-acetylglucosamine synthase-like glycosyltransferase